MNSTNKKTIRIAEVVNGESPVARSQAKSVLRSIVITKSLVLDFSEVDSIGQAFADEIFRVFASEHPSIKLVTTHTTPQIDKMISRAKNTNI